ncbi:MAG: aldehyde dehydrogenase family protein [Ignavibacteriales bacterium]|nr:aldehyde dehydrogenase family protein [Ignavibacteriales bacterium]
MLFGLGMQCLAAVCGDVNIWKPSSKVPLSAIACSKYYYKMFLIENNLPEGIFTLIVGKGSTIGEKILNDKRIPLISVTGSTSVGKHAAEVIASRFGRAILELGGNNAIIINSRC